MNTRLLIGCERSGTVRDAFRSVGVDAWSCDLEQDERGSPFHMVADVFDAVRSFDALIVHPPCTFLCSSGLHWNRRRPERAEQTAAALQFVCDLFALPVRFLCLENPVGRIGTAIRPPDQTLQPFRFGDDASKATCLWLRNLPRLRRGSVSPPRMVCTNGHGYAFGDAFTARDGCPTCGAPGRPRWSNQTDSGQNRIGPSPDRWMERSRTFPGIARAMAEQWAPILRA